jgi:hypothetical protein
MELHEAAVRSGAVDAETARIARSAFVDQVRVCMCDCV